MYGRGVVDLDPADIAALSNVRELSAALRAVRHQQARLLAVEAAVIAQTDALRAWAHDGHVNAIAWVRGETNCAKHSSERAVRRAKAIAAFPAVAVALREGVIGPDHIDVFAHLSLSRRCREVMINRPELTAALVEQACSLRFEDFVIVAGRFEAVIDPDGEHTDHDHVRARRKASAVMVGDEFVFRAEGDTATGEEIRRIFESFVEAEFQADWDLTRELFGDQASRDLMPRTHRQRCFDAFHAMTRAAASVASANGDIRLPDPLVNLVIDVDTFTATVAAWAGRPSPQRDPFDFETYRSETITGTPVDPAVVVAAAINGRVRRVVLDPANRVVNMGRTQRLFRGASRDAVLLAYQHCTHGGCLVPCDRCEIDHVLAWSAYGATNTDNGGPECRHHNLTKQRRGLRQTRAPNGRIRTWRPDGTEIAPLPRDDIA